MRSEIDAANYGFEINWMKRSVWYQPKRDDVFLVGMSDVETLYEYVVPSTGETCLWKFRDDRKPKALGLVYVGELD